MGDSNLVEEHSLQMDANNLYEAHRIKDEANALYSRKEYAKAVYLYHQCLLHARAIQQLSTFGLQTLARQERDEDEGDISNGKESPVEGGSSSNGETVEDKSVSDEMSDEKDTEKRRARLSSTSRGEEMKVEAIGISLKCYNNLAACILKGTNRTESDYIRAVEYCDKVLLAQPDNEKALYRKGQALIKANQHEAAIETLAKCKSNEAKTHLKECEESLAAERRRRDDQIRRNFSRYYAAPENGNHLNQERNENARNVQSSTMNGGANLIVPNEPND